jgi:hypothetical protein
MSWWTIGLALWLCPALVIGIALRIAVRRAPQWRSGETIGFWRDAEGTVWYPFEVKADLFAPGVKEITELLAPNAHEPTLEIEAQETSIDVFRPRPPPLPPAAAPSGL